MKDKKLRHEIRKIRDSLNPKNTKCFGFLDKEVGMLSDLIVHLDEQIEKKRPIVICPSWSKRGKCSKCPCICFLHEAHSFETREVFFVCDECANKLIGSKKANWS